MIQFLKLWRIFCWRYSVALFRLRFLLYPVTLRSEDDAELLQRIGQPPWAPIQVAIGLGWEAFGERSFPVHRLKSLTRTKIKFALNLLFFFSYWSLDSFIARSSKSFHLSQFLLPFYPQYTVVYFRHHQSTDTVLCGVPSDMRDTGVIPLTVPSVPSELCINVPCPSSLIRPAAPPDPFAAGLAGCPAGGRLLLLPTQTPCVSRTPCESHTWGFPAVPGGCHPLLTHASVTVLWLQLQCSDLFACGPRPDVTYASSEVPDS